MTDPTDTLVNIDRIIARHLKGADDARARARFHQEQLDKYLVIRKAAADRLAYTHNLVATLDGVAMMFRMPQEKVA